VAEKKASDAKTAREKKAKAAQKEQDAAAAKTASDKRRQAAAEAEAERARERAANARADAWREENEQKTAEREKAAAKRAEIERKVKAAKAAIAFTAPPPPGAGSDARICSVCRAHLPPSAFSAKQLKAKAAKRKCKGCVGKPVPESS